MMSSRKQQLTSQALLRLCGEQACEDKIKEETTCTSRCMPFAQEQLSDVCVCCGKPAKKMVYWGKAY